MKTIKVLGLAVITLVGIFGTGCRAHAHHPHRVVLAPRPRVHRAIHRRQRDLRHGHLDRHHRHFHDKNCNH